MIGQTIGNYRIKALLGEGGMGTVYLAEHTFMGWKAAVKVLRGPLDNQEALVRRFLSEAWAVRAVRHDNIVEIIDVGLLPSGLPYLLMELLEGETLGQRLRRCGRLSLAQAIDISRQTAAALAVAHDKGIVHRDLKPENLFLVRVPGADPLVTGDGEAEKVKVLDFGIAKLCGETPFGKSTTTKSGILLGTPVYMSPEQCRGRGGEIDHRTDVYALASILHEMLAGSPPFSAEASGEVLILQASAEPPPVRTLNPAVPAFVEAAILRGLAKRREDRFQSMHELAAALEPCHPTQELPAEIPRLARTIEGASRRETAPPLSTTASTTARSRVRGRLPKRAWVWAAAVAALVAVPVLIVFATHGSARSSSGRARDEAPATENTALPVKPAAESVPAPTAERLVPPPAPPVEPAAEEPTAANPRGPAVERAPESTTTAERVRQTTAPRSLTTTKVAAPPPARHADSATRPESAEHRGGHPPKQMPSPPTPPTSAPDTSRRAKPWL